jgi:hypothetical protein
MLDWQLVESRAVKVLTRNRTQMNKAFVFLMQTVYRRTIVLVIKKLKHHKSCLRNSLLYGDVILFYALATCASVDWFCRSSPNSSPIINH